MIEIERFDKDIMRKVTYYETISYVADYVQRLLEKIFEGGEIEIPVPIEKILAKLEIEVEVDEDGDLNIDALDYFSGKTLQECGGLSFFDGKKTILLRKNMDCFIAEWIKVKSIARYLVQYHEKYSEGIRLLGEIEYIQRIPMINEEIVDMVAWQIMLPWKQAIKYFLESHFFEYINDNYILKRYGSMVIVKENKIEYDDVQKINAYYQVMRTIEAKTALNEISETEIAKIMDAIYDPIETNFPRKDSEFKISELQSIRFYWRRPAPMSLEPEAHILACMSDQFEPND